MLNFHVITLFPDLIDSYCRTSIIGRGHAQNCFTVRTVNPRAFCQDNYKRVDDKPYGGGYGMVLKPEPFFLAYESLTLTTNSAVILLTPQGKVFNQSLANELVALSDIVLISGHYEGFDERISSICSHEVSVGDFVLTGGELPALILIDSIARLLPGVLGKSESLINESFHQNLLEGPQYTRPPVYKGLAVPDVLMSGDHKKIEKWRRFEAIKKTYLNRPDLLAKANLSKQELKDLEEVKRSLAEQNDNNGRQI